jgi:hypothetical protein
MVRKRHTDDSRHSSRHAKPVIVCTRKYVNHLDLFKYIKYCDLTHSLARLLVERGKNERVSPKENPLKLSSQGKKFTCISQGYRVTYVKDQIKRISEFMSSCIWTIILYLYELTIGHYIARTLLVSKISFWKCTVYWFIRAHAPCSVYVTRHRSPRADTVRDGTIRWVSGFIFKLVVLSASQEQTVCGVL